MIDINALDADDRTTFKVYVAGGDGTPDAVGFIVLGPNSSDFQRVHAMLAAKAMRDMRAASFPDIDTDDGAAEAMKQGNARQVQIATACVVDFFGFANGTEPLPFSKDSLAKILTARPRWAAQIARAAETEANFTKG